MFTRGDQQIGKRDGKRSSLLDCMSLGWFKFFIPESILQSLNFQNEGHKIGIIKQT